MNVESSFRVLCGSESRYRLFRALFATPHLDYHVRGLAEVAGVDPAQVHRLLRQLVAEGLCDKVNASPYPRYRASANHPLRQPLIDLFARVGASPESTAPPMKRIEKRSLALHKAAVQELRTNPTALKRARATIKRWMSRYKGKPPQALREWSEILAQPVDRIAELALDRSEYGDRIRKSSPLSVLVPKEDRRRIYAAN